MRKVVAVTGSSKGLGASLIKKFASFNYDVVIIYNNSKNDALKLKKELEENYDINIDVVKCDISNEEEIIDLFNRNIDILINNAALSIDSYILDKTKEEFMKVLEVNLVGTFLLCKEAVKRQVKNIINISSTDSINTFSSYNVDYSSSKAGINIVTKTFANAFSNVRIFSVLPNWINTESVSEMSSEYLEGELKRINQEKLLDKDDVANKIFELYEDENIKSGDLIEINYKGGLCIENLK